MEHIKIIFFALTSFFGIQDGRFAANKTTITIHPEKQEINILQEDLFTVIQSEEDSIMALEQWEKISHWKEKKTSWAKALDSFSIKSFNLINDNTIKPQLILKYSGAEDLQAMGIWYDPQKNQYSINNTPQDNIKTKEGKLNGYYWYFDGNRSFSFSVEPFLKMPEKYLKLKVPLKEFLAENIRE